MKLAAALLCGLTAMTMAGCDDTTTGSTSSADRHVTIVNNTNKSMTRFYGSNAGANTWEEDILGTDVLPSGSSVRINFDDGTGYCTFDFKAVFSNGQSVVQTNVDVCTTERVVF